MTSNDIAGVVIRHDVRNSFELAPLDQLDCMRHLVLLNQILPVGLNGFFIQFGLEIRLGLSELVHEKCHLMDERVDVFADGQWFLIIRMFKLL